MEYNQKRSTEQKHQPQKKRAKANPKNLERRTAGKVVQPCPWILFSLPEKQIW